MAVGLVSRLFVTGLLAALACPCCVDGLARARGRAGRGRSAAKPSGDRAARVWETQAWSHKAAGRESRGSGGGGRSRAARRSAVYDALREYDSRWQSLLLSEWRSEQDLLREQLREWPERRLEREGWLLKDLEVMRLPDCFGEPVLKCSLRASRGGGGGGSLSPIRAALPFHRFATGDVVTLCSGSTPRLPAWLEDRAPASQAAEGAIEGVVSQRTATALHIVVRQLPALLEPAAGRRQAATAHPFCLARGASAVPFERCSAAVAALSDPRLAPSTLCPELRSLIASPPSPAAGSAAGGALAEGASLPPAFLGRRGSASAAAKAATKADAGELLQRLNPSQLSVVRAALARRCTLVQGPAGSGKTRTACFLLAAAVRMRQQRDGGAGGVLAAAASNVAADELLEGLLAAGVCAVRVGQPASVRESLRSATLDAALERSAPVAAARDRLRAAQRSRQAGGGSGGGVSEAFQAVRRAEAAASLRLLKAAEVVVASCVGAGRLLELLDRGGGGGSGEGRGGGEGEPLSFETCLIDEATQATEPTSLVPLLFGAQQLVLVGDSQQLPPTVTDIAASREGLGTSLFERLQESGVQPLLLDTQYRMHPSLAEFSSRRFYGGLLRSAVRPEERPPPAGLRWPDAGFPVAFVAVRGPEQRSAAEPGGADAPRSPEDEGGTSYSNAAEAEVVARLVRALLDAGDPRPCDLGVITPYNAQALLLQRSLCEEEVEVKSVDGFQGREKELIVFSAVRSNAKRQLGFVADHRRLNVALTRARRGLVIVGDEATLAADPTWRELLSFYRRRRCVVGSADELLPRCE